MAWSLAEGGEVTQACACGFSADTAPTRGWAIFSNEKGGPGLGPAFRTGTVILEFQRG